jgi:lipopolysaccharide/colanic/teichoic acid biosynthesis glycosyltransferase
VLQRLRAPEVRERFDEEEQLVLADELVRRRAQGRWVVVRQWPALLRDGLTDMIVTRQVSERDTLARRATDLLVASLAALPALVVVGVSAASIRASMGTPVFVDVTYHGRNGQPIRLRKLRTMTTEDPRWVTPVGHILRWTRFDEVPTIIALARGELTLIGPRAQTSHSQAPLTTRPGLIQLDRWAGG